MKRTPYLKAISVIQSREQLAARVRREQAARAWKRLEDMSPREHLWAWLRDFPRPTWLCRHAGNEGTSVHFSRARAQECADNDNATLVADAQRWEPPDPVDPEDMAYVVRGPWMRPSEVDALPEC